jgi:hypothetical protein
VNRAWQGIRVFLIEFLLSELKPNRSHTLCTPQRCEILLAPDQPRDVCDDVFFKRSCGRQFGNESLMQFLELGRIFARKNSRRGIGPMFESGMALFELRHQTTPQLARANHLYIVYIVIE